MNVFELPAYYESNGVVAWRNSFMHREHKYSYVQYIIKTPTGEFILEAKRYANLLKFEKPLEALGFETFEALANHVVMHGEKGLLYGTYVLLGEKITVVLDPIVGENFDFVFIAGDEELMLSAPPKSKTKGFFGLLRFLHEVWKKEV